VCAYSLEGQPYPRLHQKQHGQQVKGGDSAPLLRSGDNPPGVLRPALEPSARGRHGPVRERSEETTAIIRVLEHLCCEESLRELGSTRKLVRDFLQGPVAIGQRVMGLN